MRVKAPNAGAWRTRAFDVTLSAKVYITINVKSLIVDGGLTVCADVKAKFLYFSISLIYYRRVYLRIPWELFLLHFFQIQFNSIFISDVVHFVLGIYVNGLC